MESSRPAEKSQTNFVDLEISEMQLGKGTGSYGVYEGELTIQQEKIRVAIKKIPPRKENEIKILIAIDEAIIKSRDEKRIWARKIIEFIGYRKNLNQLEIIFELGTLSLHKWNKEKNQLIAKKELTYAEKSQALPSIMQQVSAALAFLHEHGFIHCDIKPANVILIIDGNTILARLADFDLSKKKGEHEDIIFSKPRGTPLYRAPELFREEEKLFNSTEESVLNSEETDVYSFGMTLFEVYNDKTLYNFFKHWFYDDFANYIMRGRRPPIPAHVDRNIQGIIQKCWQQNAKARPTTEVLYKEFNKIIQSPAAEPKLKQAPSQERLASDFF